MKNKKIDTLRSKIDAIDRRILENLNKRTRYVSEIGKLKQKDGIKIYSPKREKSVLALLKKRNKGPLQNTLLETIFKAIFRDSRKTQRDVSDT